MHPTFCLWVDTRLNFTQTLCGFCCQTFPSKVGAKLLTFACEHSREQFKEGDEEVDRGNDGKTTSKSRLALNGIY